MSLTLSLRLAGVSLGVAGGGGGDDDAEAGEDG